MFKFRSENLGLVLILFSLMAVDVWSDKTSQVMDIKLDMAISETVSAQTGNQPNSLLTSIQEERETSDESFFQNKFEPWPSNRPDGGLKGLERHRLGIELFTPAFLHLGGPLLEADWYLMVGWQSRGF